MMVMMVVMWAGDNDTHLPFSACPQLSLAPYCNSKQASEEHSAHEIKVARVPVFNPVLEKNHASPGAVRACARRPALPWCSASIRTQASLQVVNA